ncbi:MAG: putative ABC transport system permease protein [Hyphomicrobiaceae bacterium]|jgi:putative ABC transport system permease protein
MSIGRSLHSVWENTRLAFETLLANRFRSFLTVLGIFIGVLLVVTVASVLNGFRQSVVDQVEQFGTNNIYLSHRPFVNIGRLSREMRLRKPLTVDDAWALRDKCPSIAVLTPILDAPTFLTRANYREEEVDTPDLKGAYPEDLEVASRVLKEGRYFTPQENRHRSRVVVLGDSVEKALFPNAGAIGKKVTIDGRQFTVIGTLEKRKAGPFGNANEDDSLFLAPYLTVLSCYPGADDVVISVRSKSGMLEQSKDEIEQVLRRRRRVRWNEDSNFEMATSDSLIKSFDDIVFAVLAVMFLLSTVGFMVGGVGVMNIMLVSVRERTREIGLRKAVGARRRDILGQFLVEATVLCTIGGVLGLLVAEGVLSLIALAVPDLASATPWWARAFAFAGSGGVGLFFGLWPAWKAASLDPVEALRYE